LVLQDFGEPTPCPRRPLGDLQQLGDATLEAFYFAFGEYDAFVLLDLPDNEAAAAVALAVDAAGGAKTKTTVLLTPQQVDDAAKRSRDAVDYRPPGT
jgi:uncharacterized protein with GYD domain